MDSNLAAKVAQDEPENGQKDPRWPEKGSQTYDPWIQSLTGTLSAAILGHLGASGANLGVSEGVLGLLYIYIYIYIWFCRLKLSVTRRDNGKSQILLRPVQLLLYWAGLGLCNACKYEVLKLVFRPWRCPEAKLDGSLAANMGQDSPKKGQEDPRWPAKGS